MSEERFCKIGFWTCAFASCPEFCDNCEDGDNYEEDEFAMSFDTEEDFLNAYFSTKQTVKQ